MLCSVLDDVHHSRALSRIVFGKMDNVDPEKHANSSGRTFVNNHQPQRDSQLASRPVSVTHSVAIHPHCSVAYTPVYGRLQVPRGFVHSMWVLQRIPRPMGKCGVGRGCWLHARPSRYSAPHSSYEARVIAACP